MVRATGQPIDYPKASGEINDEVANKVTDICKVAGEIDGEVDGEVDGKINSEVNDEIVFLHKLIRGAASRSYGVACARLAGLPEPVLARAKAILDDLENGSALAGGARAGRSREPHAGHAGTDAKDQLDLFGGAGARSPALETLRAVDVDRLTPLEALQLVATLKAMIEDSAYTQRFA